MRQLPVLLLVRRKLERAGEDLLCQFDPLGIRGLGLSGAVIQQQARAEETILGEAEGEFILPVSLRFVDGGNFRRDLTDKPVRMWTVRKCCLLVYDPATSPVEIIRILHGARDAETILGDA